MIKEVKQEQIGLLMDRLLHEMSCKANMGAYPIKQTGDKGVMYLALSEGLAFMMGFTLGPMDKYWSVDNSAFGRIWF